MRMKDFARFFSICLINIEAENCEDRLLDFDWETIPTSGSHGHDLGSPRGYGGGCKMAELTGTRTYGLMRET